MKVVATIIGLAALFNLTSATVCRGGSTCPGNWACCKNTQGKMGCCPFDNGVCAGTGNGCCAQGETVEDNKCLRYIEGRRYFTALTPIAVSNAATFLDELLENY